VEIPPAGRPGFFISLLAALIDYQGVTSSPPGLKPACFVALSGTTEVVLFPKLGQIRVFRSL